LCQRILHSKIAGKKKLPFRMEEKGVLVFVLNVFLRLISPSR